MGSEGHVFGVVDLIQDFYPLTLVAFNCTAQSQPAAFFAEGILTVEFTVAFDAAQQSLTG
jgi:hypothetical protein